MSTNARRVANVEQDAEAMRLYKEHDDQQQYAAIAAAKEIRTKLAEVTGRGHKVEDREFDALYYAAVRIYMVRRIENMAAADNRSMAESLIDCVRELLEEMPARLLPAPSAD